MSSKWGRGEGQEKEAEIEEMRSCANCMYSQNAGVFFSPPCVFVCEREAEWSRVVRVGGGGGGGKLDAEGFVGSGNEFCQLSLSPGY